MPSPGVYGTFVVRRGSSCRACRLGIEPCIVLGVSCCRSITRLILLHQPLGDSVRVALSFKRAQYLLYTQQHCTRLGVNTCSGYNCAT